MTSSILFFFAISTYSHRIQVWPLVQRLSDNGHNITFFSPHPPKNPIAGVVEFSPSILVEKLKFPDFLNLRIEKGVEESDKNWYGLPFMGASLCESMLTNSEILAWANSSHYDLVIIDAVFNDCGLGFAHKFGAKWIQYATSSSFAWWPDNYGSLDESATYPQHTIHLPQKMSFFQKIQNSLSFIYWHIFNSYVYYPMLDKVIKENLDVPDFTSVEEMHKNTSLVFTNSHYSDDYARSFPPSIVSIGGIHCTEKTKALPKNIENFIDGSDNGFVYVSLGTFVQFTKMPDKYKKIFMETFRKFSNTRFVWKFDGEWKDEFPSNVFGQPWMPQQDILAHPKIKAFISHGGLLGIQEAIFHGVPLIVIPIFAEQDYNAESIDARGNGIRLEISTLTENKLETALSNILTEKSYKEKMDEVSMVFRDRPTKPLDSAVWWVEYVLRHKDTSHLRSLGTQQTWYQRRLLDVWLFLFSSILVATFTFLLFVSKFFNCIKSNLKQKKD